MRVPLEEYRVPRDSIQLEHPRLSFIAILCLDNDGVVSFTPWQCGKTLVNDELTKDGVGEKYRRGNDLLTMNSPQMQSQDGGSSSMFGHAMPVALTIDAQRCGGRCSGLCC